MSEYNRDSNRGDLVLPSALLETYNALQRSLAAIDLSVAVLNEAQHQLDVSAVEHAQATGGSSHDDNVKTIALRQEAGVNTHEQISRLYLTASLIGHAANVLHGMSEPAPSSTHALPSQSASNESSTTTEGVIEPKIDRLNVTDQWHEGELLSDPSQIHHPTSIAEHPNGGLEVVVEGAPGTEGIVVSGTVRNGEVEADDILGTPGQPQPAQAAEAARTFVREATRRGAEKLHASVTNSGVMHNLIRNYGVENITVNGQPTTAKDLRDKVAVEDGAVRVSVDLTDRKVKKYLERPNYR